MQDTSLDWAEPTWPGHNTFLRRTAERFYALLLRWVYKSAWRVFSKPERLLFYSELLLLISSKSLKMKQELGKSRLNQNCLSQGNRSPKICPSQLIWQIIKQFLQQPGMANILFCTCFTRTERRQGWASFLCWYPLENWPGKNHGIPTASTAFLGQKVQESGFLLNALTVRNLSPFMFEPAPQPARHPAQLSSSFPSLFPPSLLPWGKHRGGGNALVLPVGRRGYACCT